MSEVTEKLPPPLEFPKSRYASPMTLEINGRRIFARGANFVSPDIFPARLNRDRYAKLIDLAREAGLNLLRCRGGRGAHRRLLRAVRRGINLQMPG